MQSISVQTSKVLVYYYWNNRGQLHFQLTLWLYLPLSDECIYVFTSYFATSENIKCGQLVWSTVRSFTNKKVIVLYFFQFIPFDQYTHISNALFFQHVHINVFKTYNKHKIQENKVNRSPYCSKKALFYLYYINSALSQHLLRVHDLGNNP